MQYLPNVIYIFYSKYSPVCMSMIKTFTQLPLVLPINIEYICIDNKDVRKLILTSNYGIQSVPCVFAIVKEKNVMEKYEGQNAISYLQNLYFSSQPQDNNINPNEKQEDPPTKSAQVRNVPQERRNTQSVTLINELSEPESDSVNPPVIQAEPPSDDGKSASRSAAYQKAREIEKERSELVFKQN